MLKPALFTVAVIAALDGTYTASTARPLIAWSVFAVLVLGTLACFVYAFARK